ncbi:hypothetical protein ACP275_10G076000 [Erythranthe tilingii]
MYNCTLAILISNVQTDVVVEKLWWSRSLWQGCEVVSSNLWWSRSLWQGCEAVSSNLMPFHDTPRDRQFNIAVITHQEIANSRSRQFKIALVTSISSAPLDHSNLLLLFNLISSFEC